MILNFVFVFMLSICWFLTGLELGSFFSIFTDSPSWGFNLQDPATWVMEVLISFNSKLIILIFFLIALITWSFQMLLNFLGGVSLKQAYSDDPTTERIWTSSPAIVLLFLTLPSFTLLYFMEKIEFPSITLKIAGSQWFWQYEVDDYNWCKDGKQLNYSCYILAKETFKENSLFGFFRNLETNKRVTLPTNTHIRLIVSSLDVLHSWTIPSFGIKVDACPGRVNQFELAIKRPGVFFGQCSEICGLNHGFMPISLISLASIVYYYTVSKLIADGGEKYAKIFKNIKVIF